MCSLIYAWTNGWANHRDAGKMRRHRNHYDVTVMSGRLQRLFERMRLRWWCGCKLHLRYSHHRSAVFYNTDCILMIIHNILWHNQFQPKWPAFITVTFILTAIIQTRFSSSNKSPYDRGITDKFASQSLGIGSCSWTSDIWIARANVHSARCSKVWLTYSMSKTYSCEKLCFISSYFLVCYGLPRTLVEIGVW